MYIPSPLEKPIPLPTLDPIRDNPFGKPLLPIRDNPFGKPLLPNPFRDNPLKPDNNFTITQRIVDLELKNQRLQQENNQLNTEINQLKARFKKEILEDKILELEKFIEDKKKELSELKSEVIK